MKIGNVCWMRMPKHPAPGETVHWEPVPPDEVPVDAQDPDIIGALLRDNADLTNGYAAIEREDWGDWLYTCVSIPPEA